MIDITIETTQTPAAQITVIRLTGEIDATNAAIVQQKVLPLTTPGCRLILDLSQVGYMSSAGLRMLLSLYRQAAGKQGQVMLVGLSEELTDTMSMTGFLGYFKTEPTLATGLQTFGTP